VIPTTSGTGSEVTMVAVVSDTQKMSKWHLLLTT
jgi:alcohol dehydrogenase class IV